MAPPAEVADAFVALAGRDERIGRLVHDVESASVVIVNGEGDLILTQPPRRKLVFLLAVMELAHRVGTPCVYVNAMVSDPPSGDRNADVAGWARATLQRCRLVALRDEWSLELARDLDLHADPRWIPDALFSWHDRVPFELKDDPLTRQGWPLEGGPPLDLDDEPYVCISGSSAYARAIAPPIDGYCRLVERLARDGRRVVLVEGAEADEFLRVVGERTGAPLVPWATNIYVSATILARSRLFVSGRHHPTILAALGGALPVMIGSNSHKNVSLQQLLGVDDPVEADPSLDDGAVSAICERAALAHESHGDERRAALRARCGELANEAAQLPAAIRDAIGA
jgi:polysaccharide pyruvyl transferase WcaK-like protein